MLATGVGGRGELGARPAQRPAKSGGTSAFRERF